MTNRTFVVDALDSLAIDPRAFNGHGAMSDASPQSAPKRTSDHSKFICSRLDSHFEPFHVKTNLLNGINVIWVVQSLLQKYSAFPKTQISDMSLAVPAHPKGAFAIVTNAGRGMRWTRLVSKTRAPLADGEVVWS